MVWKLDRLGRSLSHLLAIVTSLKDKRVAFRSLTENLDTTTPSGEFLFQVFGALALYECALIQERVVAGLAAARKRSRIGGRPQAITGEKLDAIIAALDGDMSKAAVCRNFNVKRATLIALRYFPLAKTLCVRCGANLRPSRWLLRVGFRLHRLTERWGCLLLCHSEDCGGRISWQRPVRNGCGGSGRGIAT